jgi:hypothetical protein
MATAVLSRLPVYDSQKNKYEKTEKALDENGNLIFVDSFLYTNEEVESAKRNLPKMVDYEGELGKLTYSIGEVFVNNSLNVYFNGLNVTPDLSSVGPDSFSLNNNYLEVVNEESRIFATYLIER